MFNLGSEVVFWNDIFETFQKIIPQHTYILDLLVWCLETSKKLFSQMVVWWWFTMVQSVKNDQKNTSKAFIHFKVAPLRFHRCSGASLPKWSMPTIHHEHLPHHLESIFAKMGETPLEFMNGQRLEPKNLPLWKGKNIWTKPPPFLGAPLIFSGFNPWTCLWVWVPFHLQLASEPNLHWWVPC